MSNKTVLYIGVGLHLKPIQTFAGRYNKFVFVDSLPLNSYGFDYYYRGFYYGQFLEKLQLKFEKYGYKLVSSQVLTSDFTEINRPNLEATLFKYEKDGIVVHYYISTGLPRHLYSDIGIEQLKQDVQETNALIICGHHPHKIVLQYIINQIDFILYSSTCYPADNNELVEEDDKGSIFHCILDKNGKYRDKMCSFSFISHNQSMDEMKSFVDYIDFYRYYREQSRTVE